MPPGPRDATKGWIRPPSVIKMDTLAGQRRGRGEDQGHRCSTTRSLLDRLVLVLIGFAVSAGRVDAAPGSPAQAEAGFVSRIASERVARGLDQLEGASDLQTVARRHAQRMATRGEPYHNPNLGSEVQGWAIVSENVGAGTSVDQVHQAFMSSQTHREIILSPELTQVGVGVVRASDGQIYVVEVFRRPSSQSTAPAPVAVEPVSQPAAAAPLPRVASVRAAAPRSVPAAPVVEPTTTLPPPVVAEVATPVPVVEALAAGRAAVPAPDDPTDGVPVAAWLAAFLLAAVVALQALVVRRTGALGR